MVLDREWEGYWSKEQSGKGLGFQARNRVGTLFVMVKSWLLHNVQVLLSAIS